MIVGQVERRIHVCIVPNSISRKNSSFEKVKQCPRDISYDYVKKDVSSKSVSRKITKSSRSGEGRSIHGKSQSRGLKETHAQFHVKFVAKSQNFEARGADQF